MLSGCLDQFAVNRQQDNRWVNVRNRVGDGMNCDLAGDFAITIEDIKESLLNPHKLPQIHISPNGTFLEIGTQTR